MRNTPVRLQWGVVMGSATWLALLAALLVAGCGGGGGGGSSAGGAGTATAPPTPSTGTVVVRFVLQARTVPPWITDLRFTGFEAGGATAWGPVTRPKAEEIVLAEVPVAVRTLRVEYLSDGVLEGVHEEAVDIPVGGVLVIEDPPFEDALAVDSIRIVSRTPAGVAADGNNGPVVPSWSASRFAFASDAPNLRGNSFAALLLGLASSPALQLVSVSTDGANGNGRSAFPDMSWDGRIVVFDSFASDLVPGDTNGTGDVFVRDLEAGTTVRVSVSADGTQADGSSWDPRISGDGRFVVFQSRATNLVPGDTNGKFDLFVRDLQTGGIERVNLGPGGVQANGSAPRPTISQDGRYVGFVSEASNLVPGDTNNANDAFVRDRLTGQTERVSVGVSGVQGNSGVPGGSWPALSGDGRYVAFRSTASNLGLGTAMDGLYVRDRVAGQTMALPLPAGFGTSSDGAGRLSFSADGRFLAFETTRSYAAADTDPTYSIYVHDRARGLTALVSASALGQSGNGDSMDATLSPNGSAVGFNSMATNLVPDDANGFWDSFLAPNPLYP